MQNSLYILFYEFHIFAQRLHKYFLSQDIIVIIDASKKYMQGVPKKTLHKNYQKKYTGALKFKYHFCITFGSVLMCNNILKVKNSHVYGVGFLTFNILIRYKAKDW